jgi:hypothetical protein
VGTWEQTADAYLYLGLRDQLTEAVSVYLPPGGSLTRRKVPLPARIESARYPALSRPGSQCLRTRQLPTSGYPILEEKQAPLCYVVSHEVVDIRSF